jgi:hypothetical protein
MLTRAETMDAVISRSIDRLSRAIETSAAGLNPDEAETLRGASRRSATALSRLRARLAGQDMADVDPAHSATEFPLLREPAARSLLNELDGIIGDVEQEILVPAEKELSSEELAKLKRAIGQVWGWIVCDLQDPIWKQFPQTAPSGR